MSKKYFKITPANRADIMPRLGEYIRRQDKPLRIKCEEDKETRSSQQNRLYWELLGLVSKETGNDKDDLHSFCVEKFLLPRIVTLNGIEKEVKATTTKLNTADFSYYFEQVQAFFAVNLGIVLPAQY